LCQDFDMSWLFSFWGLNYPHIYPRLISLAEVVIDLFSRL
jgi:hypothetical protein